MIYFEYIFFENNDPSSKRTEYRISQTFFQGVSDASNSEGVGWSTDSVRRLHLDLMSDYERERFGVDG